MSATAGDTAEAVGVTGELDEFAPGDIAAAGLITSTIVGCAVISKASGGIVTELGEHLRKLERGMASDAGGLSRPRGCGSVPHQPRRAVVEDSCAVATWIVR
jgi:hypothetical protein